MLGQPNGCDNNESECLNSYRNLRFGAIGHCVMPVVPSITFVLFWSMPFDRCRVDALILHFDN
jgi:hypothetical protein